jgi:predicted nucleic acid-binding protein
MAEILDARHAGDAAIQAFQSAAWITVKPVTDLLAVEVLLDELDLGEAETIVLEAALRQVGELS